MESQDDDEHFMYDLEELVQFAATSGIAVSSDPNTSALEDKAVMLEITKNDKKYNSSNEIEATDMKLAAEDSFFIADVVVTEEDDTSVVVMETSEIFGEVMTNVDSVMLDGVEEAQKSYQESAASLEDAQSAVEDVQGSEDPSGPAQGNKKYRKEAARDAREKGVAYTGFRRGIKGKTNVIKQDVIRECRKMGEGCNRKKCAKWSTRKCDTISEEKRNEIFHSFWKDLSWEKKKTYVCTLMSPKQLNTGSRRGVSWFYHLRVNTTIVPVCKKMFLDTLGLGEGMVAVWRKSYAQKITTESDSINLSTTPKTSHHSGDGSDDDVTTPSFKKRLATRIQHAREFLGSIPLIPSHYRRKDSKKSYLQGDVGTKQELYRLYCLKCEEDRILKLSRPTYFKLVKELNIGVFKPRKDQCDLCCAYKNCNVSPEEYEKHVAEKDRAREEKERDKLKAINTKQCHVLTCDLMNVQCTPLIRASAAYYKLKLIVHNFSIFNLETHDAQNYWWDETIATLDASTYASCLCHYIEELTAEEHRPTVIVFSDGCTAQNRNNIMANALLHLSARLRITIVQKFLIKGHTQMEVDSVHSHIESSIKWQDVFIPSNMITITQRARKSPEFGPYRAMYLDPDFVKDYTRDLVYSSIRPGLATKNDPYVTHIHCLEYLGEQSTINYKLSFDDDFLPIPRRQLQNLDPTKPYSFVAKRKERINLPLDKWNDLQSLKPMLPKDCHTYYDLLPKTAESIRQQKRKMKNNEEREEAGKNTKKMIMKRKK